VDERDPDEEWNRTAGRRSASRNRLFAQQIPGWALVALTVFIVVTRDPPPTAELIGTLLGFACVLLGAPVFLRNRSQ
jgi:hypothetical protein